MSLLDIFVAILVGSLLILTAVAFIGISRSLLQGRKSPSVQAVVDSLTPYVYKAIFAGEKFALTGLDNLQVKLTGADKKVIADSIYDALPDFLRVGPIAVPPKVFISRDHFEELVKNAYEDAAAYVARNEQFFKSKVDALNPIAG